MAISSPNMSLLIWNQGTDQYDHAQLANNWAKVDEHDHTSGKGIQIPTGGIADGAITSPKIASGVLGLIEAEAEDVGVTKGGIIRRGVIDIPDVETTTSTTYTTLTTPDQIANIVVPSDGLIKIAYRALFKLTGATNAGAVAIFVGSNQVKFPAANAVPAVQEQSLAAAADNYSYLATRPTGDGWGNVDSGTSDSSLVTTGTAGDFNPLMIEVAAGTYTVSIQWHVNATAGGTLSVKERKLWVWTLGF